MKIRKMPSRSEKPEEAVYSAESFTEKQAFHRNLQRSQLAELLESSIPSSFRNAVIETATETITVLTNKRNRRAVLRKKKQVNPLLKPETGMKPLLEGHDRKKRYIIEEGIPSPFLVKLGIMTEEGNVHAARYSKFRQINRFLEYVRDVLPELDTGKTIEIVDFGCGKSYLTFAIYHYLVQLKKLSVHITGIDLKEDVIRHCRKTADSCGYTGMDFLCGDVADYDSPVAPDLVITLHACDTATDYALAFAVNRNARCILSVPCCQHELNSLTSRKVPDEALSAMFRYGIVKERLCALATDVMRAELLEKSGYNTQIMEFIDMEDTPKNLLIRAVRKNGTESASGDPAAGKQSAGSRLQSLTSAFGNRISLDNFLTKN